MTGPEAVDRIDEMLADFQPALPTDPYRRASAVRALFQPEDNR